MPIRLNLLAEAQAAEELRRRDPVKRAIWGSGLAIAIMLVWSSSLQVKAMLARGELNRIGGQISSRTNAYAAVTARMRKIQDIQQRIQALDKLSANRFLNATLLNALQQCMVADVHLVRVKAEQTYSFAEQTKSVTNEDRVVPGKPATSTERIVVTLEGVDSAPIAGDQVGKFKQALAANSYFLSVLGKTNEVHLKSMSAPTIAAGAGRPSVLFSLECRYPEKTR
jgi:hypothetical protein